MCPSMPPSAPFFFAVLGHSVHERNGPPLELILVAGGQIAGSVQVLRGAVNLELDAREGIAQALLDQRDGEMRDVDADPLALELLGGVNGGAAAAERVEHHVAFVRGDREDALEEREGLFCRIPEALVSE
jgi:hypothetical protein